MKQQENRLQEQSDVQQTAGFSADRLVIGVAAGVILGAVLGFLVGSIALCLIIGVLAGLVTGYLLDRRQDRAQGITQSPLGFWTAEKKAEQTPDAEQEQLQEHPQETDAEQSEQ